MYIYVKLPFCCSTSTSTNVCMYLHTQLYNNFTVASVACCLFDSLSTYVYTYVFIYLHACTCSGMATANSKRSTELLMFILKIWKSIKSVSKYFVETFIICSNYKISACGGIEGHTRILLLLHFFVKLVVPKARSLQNSNTRKHWLRALKIFDESCALL